MAKTKLNVNLSQELKDLIYDLEKRTNSSSLAEVVRRSVCLLDFIETEQAAGSKVIVIDKGGKETEVIIL